MLKSIFEAKSGFNNSLHGFRGIAALMVYIGHSINGYQEHLCSDCSLEPVMEKFYFLGAYGVEVFFFLSGYVIFSASLKSNTSNFVSHRFWRIYPVFLLFTVIFFVLNHFIQKAPEQDNIWYLLSNIVFLDLFLGTPPLSPIAWSITYEVWYYIMTFMLLRPLVLGRNRILFFLALLMWVYFLWRFPITLYYVAGVATNIFVRKYDYLLQKIPGSLANIVQFASLACVLWYAFVDNYIYKWDLLAGTPEVWLLMFALTLFMLLLFHRDSHIPQWLQSDKLMALGTVSYTLYLAHPYSYLVSRMITQKLVAMDLNFTVVTLLYIMLNLLLTTILVMVVHQFIEKFFYKWGTGKAIYTPGKPAPDKSSEGRAGVRLAG